MSTGTAQQRVESREEYLRNLLGDELFTRFDDTFFHPERAIQRSGVTLSQINRLTNAYGDLAVTICEMTQDTRSRSLALTRLEDSLQRAVAALGETPAPKRPQHISQEMVDVIDQRIAYYAGVMQTQTAMIGAELKRIGERLLGVQPQGDQVDSYGGGVTDNKQFAYSPPTRQ
jgi:hypothetical protein